MQKSLEEIKHEFVRNLVIPTVIPERQFFFCPVGLVGTGKSTVTKPVSNRFTLLRISSDELRKILLDNGFDYSPVKDILGSVVQEYARKGYSIAFDMDCGNVVTKQLIDALSKELNVKTFWVHINPPEEFVFEKFKNFPLELSWLAPGKPQVMIDNYLAQKEKRKQENTSFDFMYVFDTSKENIEEQVGECIEKIKASEEC